MSEGGVSSGAAGRPMRADARRNRDRILVAAEGEISRHGADASLEEIARRAGVGSATLHRHFPSRAALLDAVFHGRVEALCARACEFDGGNEDPGDALVAWLREVGAYVAATRGLAASLLHGERGEDLPRSETCHAMIAGAGEGLLRRAQKVEAVRSGVSIDDLLALVSAVSLAAEQGPGGEAGADRLLTLAIDGIYPYAPATEGTQPKR